MNALFREVGRSGLEGLLRTLAVDLVLVDREMSAAAMLAYGAGLPVCLYTTTFSVFPDDGAPPLSFGSDGAHARLGWLRAEINGLAARLFGRVIGVDDWDRAHAELARRCGFPAALLDLGVRPRPRLRLPELILCPAELDLPAVRAAVAADRLRAHGAPFIDIERREARVPGLPPPSLRPLVYCSLGSQGQRARHGASFLRNVITAFATLPDHDLVVAVGAELPPAALGDVPANVTVVARAPQLALLRRARLMITHAGLNSVKECVYFGVPMIVVPQLFDQPGNAARVVHHGLGERASLAGASPSSLRRLVRKVLDTDRYRENADRMAQLFRERQQRSDGLAFVEAQLDRAARERTAG